MSLVGDLTTLVIRETVATEIQSSCELGNKYNGRIGLRIAAIFVIWLGSSLGACFPIFAKRNKGLKVPEWTFFVAKYFGSGVIVATAFIHLLAPAHEALSNPCLTGQIIEYPWVEGIMMMTVFVLFFVELMVMRYARFGDHEHSHENPHEHSEGQAQVPNLEHEYELGREREDIKAASKSITIAPDTSSERRRSRNAHVPGEDHLGHQREHQGDEENNNGHNAEDYAAQMTAIFILEFGIIFHSIFIGLTLAVAGEEFETLFAVLVFHQTFEGLGLGSRLAVTPWPKTKKWTAYLLALAYGLSTPIAIAVGLGLRNTYPPGSATTLIVNGVFDSISAGILIYTGLVELMAHEFMFSNVMRKAPLKVVLGAFGLMCLGAALMALLGKWA
jgi:solute carrier family 39 (zinc transporter), member 1/2/3